MLALAMTFTPWWIGRQSALLWKLFQHLPAPLGGAFVRVLDHHLTWIVPGPAAFWQWWWSGFQAVAVGLGAPLAAGGVTYLLLPHVWRGAGALLVAVVAPAGMLGLHPLDDAVLARLASALQRRLTRQLARSCCTRWREGWRVLHPRLRLVGAIAVAAVLLVRLVWPVAVVATSVAVHRLVSAIGRA